MKKLILFLFTILLFFKVQAQEVLPQQQTLITKIAATWCPHCGTWAWEANDSIIADNPTNAIIMTVHHSGGLQTPVAKDFTSNLGSIGQPQFFLNNMNIRLFSNNIDEKRAEIKSAVSANASTTPIANTGVLFQLDGQELTTIVKTKFFQAAAGEFYVGTYLVEEGVLYAQQGQGGIVAHKNILRASFTEDSFGRPIQTPIPIVADATFSQINTLILEEDWNKDQLEIVTIIWKKEGDTFQFINGSTMQVVDDSNIEETPEPVDTTTSTIVSFNALDFSQFPWLDSVVDTQDCCDIKTIKVYNSGIYQYVYLERDSTCASKPSALYFEDGTFYCSDVDCRSSYDLSIQDLAMAWNCTAAAIEEIEIPANVPDETGESDESIFSDYPWLEDVLADYDCCVTVTSYMNGIYNYIYIRPSADCSETGGQLYFQDGTFYCRDAATLDCREAYRLSSNTARILSACPDNQ